MKRNLKRILSLAMVFVLLCGVLPTGALAADDYMEDTFSLDQHHMTGYVGETAEQFRLDEDTLSYSFLLTDMADRVTMVSDKPTVASVEYVAEHDYWALNYHQVGTANIIATTDSGLTDTCVVTVQEVETIFLNQPFSVTVEPHDTKIFAFNVTEDGVYSLYSENGKGNLNIQRGYNAPFSGRGVDTQPLYKGETVFSVWNNSENAETYTLQVRKAIPAEGFVFEKEVYTGYPGDTLVLKGDTEPVWSVSEEPTFSSSDERVVYYDLPGSRWVTLGEPGQATITATLSNGATGQCTVNVLDYEPIHEAESITLTLGNSEETRFEFTPEKDGVYVFYMPSGESGYSEEFFLSISCGGDYIASSIGSYYHYSNCSVFCEMEAGKTYILCARNDYLDAGDITGTVTLEYFAGINEPHLFRAFIGVENEYFWDSRMHYVTGNMGGSDVVDFYFGNKDSVIHVKAEELQSSDESIVKIVRDEYLESEGKVYLAFEGYGNTTLYYTHTDGTRYYIPVYVELPDFGFYSTPTASPETFLESFTVTEENNVIYYVAKEGYAFTELTLDDSYMAFPEGSTVEMSPDGTYAKITIGDFAGVNVLAYVSYKNLWDSSGMTYGDEIYLSSALPGIYMRNPGYDENTGYVKEDPNETVDASVNGKLGQGCSYYCYYFDGKTEHRLSSADLFILDDSIIKLNDGRYNLVNVDLIGVGDTSIFYTAPTGITYSIPVHVELPQFGFYNEPVASGDAYCIDGFTITEQNNVLYLVASSDAKLLTVEPDVSWPESEITISDDGTCATIRIIGVVDESVAYSTLICTFTTPYMEEYGGSEIYYSSIKLFVPKDCNGEHTWDEGTVVDKASCMNEGTMSYVCIVCGETKTEAVPSEGHSEVVDEAVEATCTATGLTEGSHCSKCYEVLTAQKTIPALGHKYEGGKCNVCGGMDPDYKEPTPPVIEDNPFTDIADDAWYVAPVLWAKENNVTGGTSATTFGPDDSCTRAQVVTFLWAANGKPEPESMDNPFTDVADDAWYLKPVLWAVEQGITGGVAEGKFGPNQTCTRAQIATFLYAAKGKPAVNGTSTFKDVADSDWFAKPVIWAAENEVTGGIGDGKFGPNNTCTRAQVVTFLYKVYGNK